MARPWCRGSAGERAEAADAAQFFILPKWGELGRIGENWIFKLPHELASLGLGAGSWELGAWEMLNKISFE